MWFKDLVVRYDILHEHFFNAYVTGLVLMGAFMHVLIIFCCMFHLFYCVS